MKHVICYEGVNVSLGLMQEAYVPLFLPWINWRIGIEGTLQRPPYTHAMGVEWVRGFDKTKGSNEVFAILLKSKKRSRTIHRYVGHTSIHGIQWPKGAGTTGSFIVDKEARGRGIGTEAKLLLLYHSFMILGLRKVRSSVKAFNAPSLGHLIKCGYTHAGRYKASDPHEGSYVDTILLEVFRDDWEPIWNEYKKTQTLPALTGEQRTWVQKETSI